jgi:hypothetical protein
MAGSLAGEAAAPFSAVSSDLDSAPEMQPMHVRDVRDVRDVRRGRDGPDRPGCPCRGQRPRSGRAHPGPPRRPIVSVPYILRRTLHAAARSMAQPNAPGKRAGQVGCKTISSAVCNRMRPFHAGFPPCDGS